MNNESFKKELVIYLIVGLIVVLVDFISYNLYNSKFSIDFSLSKRLSFLTGSTFSFFLNKYFTFKSPKWKISEIFSFSVIYFSSFVLNSFTHDVLLNYLSGNYPFIIATFVSVLINYLGQKLIVFKNI